jgi:hypothetical protein
LNRASWQTPQLTQSTVVWDQPQTVFAPTALVASAGPPVLNFPQPRRRSRSVSRSRACSALCSSSSICSRDTGLAVTSLWLASPGRCASIWDSARLDGGLCSIHPSAWKVNSQKSVSSILGNSRVRTSSYLTVLYGQKSAYLSEFSACLRALACDRNSWCPRFESGSRHSEKD